METNLEQERSSAEARGAALVRERLRRVLEDSRRVVRLGDHQIEVVEVAALSEVLEED